MPQKKKGGQDLLFVTVGKILLFAGMCVSTCKKCAKVWASLGFFFSKRVCRQDSVEVNAVPRSDCEAKKASCNSCRKEMHR